MKDKIRLIIMIGLVAMLAVSLFMSVQVAASKKAIELQRNALKNENDNLTRKIEEISKERRQLQERVDALTNELGKASQERQDTRKQYESLLKERDGLVEKVKTLQRSSEQLRADLSNLSKEKQRLGQNLDDNLSPLRSENTQLKQQLDNLDSQKRKIETELGQLKGEKSDLEQKFSQIDSLLQQRLTRLRYMSIKDDLDAILGGTATAETQARIEVQTAPQPEKESVVLPPIVVKPQTQTETPAWPKKDTAVKPTGTVLEVNKEGKFVIIDLGQDVGVKPGDILKVYRQGNSIANIEVIQVRQSISACDIKEEAIHIEAGDIVR